MLLLLLLSPWRLLVQAGNLQHCHLCKSCQSVCSIIYCTTRPWTQLFHWDREQELGVSGDKLEALTGSWELIYLDMDFLPLSFLLLLLCHCHKILIISYVCYGKIVARKKLSRLSASDIKVNNMFKNQTKHYEWVQILFCVAQEALLKILIFNSIIIYINNLLYGSKEIKMNNFFFFL